MFGQVRNALNRLDTANVASACHAHVENEHADMFVFGGRPQTCFDSVTDSSDEFAHIWEIGRVGACTVRYRAYTLDAVDVLHFGELMTRGAAFKLRKTTRTLSSYHMWLNDITNSSDVASQTTQSICRPVGPTDCDMMV